jgi:hypothetical protein
LHDKAYFSTLESGLNIGVASEFALQNILWYLRDWGWPHFRGEFALQDIYWYLRE